MKRILLVIGVIALVGLAFLIEGKRNSRDTDVTRIVVANLMSHPALDSVEAGVYKQLLAAGYVEGKNLEIIKLNANGQVAMSAAIADQAYARKPDAIVAITTPIAQSMVNKSTGIPIIFAAVTDPVSAGVVESMASPAENISGTSDAWPYNEQLQLIKDIFPDAHTIGVVYNPGEAASQYGIKEIRKYAINHEFKIVEGAASNTNEVFSAASAISSKVDVLFLSSDNTVISGMAGALQAANRSNIPLFVGDSGTVEKGALAAVSVGYDQLGDETGRILVRMLKGERNIPIYVGVGDEIHVNLDAAKSMGIDIPVDVLKRAKKIYKSDE